MEPRETKNNRFSRFLRSYRSLPDKKRYVEFFTAVLTVPVLLTVIILNVSALNANKTESKEEKKEEPKQVVITIPSQAVRETSNTQKTDPTPTSEACKKEIGEITISSPEEGEAVTANPVSITIEQEEGYCSVVWSYRINNGKWSEYDDKSIALYNPPSGEIIFELRVKSLATKEEKVLTRTFTYEGAPTATPSAAVSNSN